MLDTLENFDGLERLIVIAVGLDAPLNEGAEDMLETRSRLYRALTRAHMLAIVVNETIAGGWLEWLKLVKLHGEFDRDAEVARLKRDAADAVVKKRVEEFKAALEAAVQKRKLQTQKSFRFTEAEDKLIRSASTRSSRSTARRWTRRRTRSSRSTRSSGTRSERRSRRSRCSSRRRRRRS